MNNPSQHTSQTASAAQVLDRPPLPSGEQPSAVHGKAPATASQDGADPQGFLKALLQLESQARGAQTVKELCFVLANETRRLVTFRQALIVSVMPSRRTVCQVEAVSSVAVVDRKAPMVNWVERVLRSLWENQSLQTPCHLTATHCPKNLQADWKRFAFPHVLWCPLVWGNQEVMGGLWLGRETPWKDAEIQLVRRFAETVAHAWQALGGTKKSVRNWTFPKKWIWGVVGILVLAMFLPVRLSTLAPVEVVARDPAVVTAPLDGVLAEILVQPNTVVQK